MDFKELIELAKDTERPIFRNQVWGDFMFLEYTNVIVGEHMRSSDTLSYLVANKKLKEKSEVDNASSGLSKLGPNEMLKKLLALNKSKHLEVKQLCGNFNSTIKYFDFIDSRTLILKKWVVDICKHDIDFLQATSEGTLIITIPLDETKIQEVIDRIVKKYVPTCYLPDGEYYDELPLSVVTTTNTSELLAINTPN